MVGLDRLGKHAKITQVIFQLCKGAREKNEQIHSLVNVVIYLHFS
jgi:hypothetical protein